MSCDYKASDDNWHPSHLHLPQQQQLQIPNKRAEPALSWRWSTVSDGGPTSRQRRLSPAGSCGHRCSVTSSSSSGRVRIPHYPSAVRPHSILARSSLRPGGTCWNLPVRQINVKGARPAPANPESCYLSLAEGRPTCVRLSRNSPSASASGGQRLHLHHARCDEARFKRVYRGAARVVIAVWGALFGSLPLPRKRCRYFWSMSVRLSGCTTLCPARGMTRWYRGGVTSGQAGQSGGYGQPAPLTLHVRRHGGCPRRRRGWPPVCRGDGAGDRRRGEALPHSRPHTGVPGHRREWHGDGRGTRTRVGLKMILRISSPWTWKGVSATLGSGWYTLSYPRRGIISRAHDLYLMAFLFWIKHTNLLHYYVEYASVYTFMQPCRVYATCSICWIKLINPCTAETAYIRFQGSFNLNKIPLKLIK